MSDRSDDLITLENYPIKHGKGQFLYLMMTLEQSDQHSQLFVFVQINCKCNNFNAIYCIADNFIKYIALPIILIKYIALTIILLRYIALAIYVCIYIGSAYYFD